MLGAIIGDIVGSRFEFNNYKAKDFEFFHPKCFFTDDTIMSLAIAKSLLLCKSDYSDLSDKAISYMQEIGRPYPNCGYGGRFYHWMYSDKPKSYGSFGNGSAMRVSACGIVAQSLDEAIELSKKVTIITHDHPEGIKGAEAVAVAIYFAKTGSSIEFIKSYIQKLYYPMNFTIDEIRPNYCFNESCQGSVPQALEAFFEAKDFEDAIRNAVSIGGDSDTLAAITGGIAEAYFGIPNNLRDKAKAYLDDKLLHILNKFEDKFVPKSF
jgi:ADP-ribosylglycohydrolase